MPARTFPVPVSCGVSGPVTLFHLLLSFLPEARLRHRIRQTRFQPGPFLPTERWTPPDRSCRCLILLPSGRNPDKRQMEKFPIAVPHTHEGFHDLADRHPQAVFPVSRPQQEPDWPDAFRMRHALGHEGVALPDDIGQRAIRFKSGMEAPGRQSGAVLEGNERQTRFAPEYPAPETGRSVAATPDGKATVPRGRTRSGISGHRRIRHTDRG